MTYTDAQLKAVFPKLLPSTVEIGWNGQLFWILDGGPKQTHLVIDTELLHLCWLAEETLTDIEVEDYWSQLQCAWAMIHSAWQQRTIALAKTKGIEIV